MTHSNEITTKFLKELSKFIEWAEKKEYYVIDANGVMIKWDKNMVMFTEPGRNKLEAFLKIVCDTFIVKNKKNDETVEDAKLLSLEFKYSNKEKCNLVEKLDDDIDTSDTFYLDELKCDTKTLETLFGKPLKLDEPWLDRCRYEWKISIRGHVYSIYDWVNEDGSFDLYQECKWYIAGLKMSKKDLKIFNEFIGCSIESNLQSEEKSDTESEEKRNDTESKKNKKSAKKSIKSSDKSCFSNLDSRADIDSYEDIDIISDEDNSFDDLDINSAVSFLKKMGANSAFNELQVDFQ